MPPSSMLRSSPSSAEAEPCLKGRSWALRVCLDATHRIPDAVALRVRCKIWALTHKSLINLAAWLPGSLVTLADLSDYQTPRRRV